MSNGKERRMKVGVPGGHTVEGFEVQIAKASEPWTELHLSDGTLIRVKTIVASIVRIDGQFDNDGNPVYVIKSTPAISLIEVPDHLRKKG
jgi:hypothetical protein